MMNYEDQFSALALPALPEKRHNWLRPIAGLRAGQPVCANHNCEHRLPLWNGVIGRVQGVLTNTGWFCGPDCFERTLTEQLFSYLRREPAPEPTALHRMPIGLLLLERGEITSQQLQESLLLHKASGLRMGDCIRRITGAPESLITTAVATQWSCPVFPLPSIDSSLARMIPLALLERYHMLPVHLGHFGKKMYIGFAQGIDYSALYGIEQLMDCETKPCTIASSAWNEIVEQRQRGQVWDDVVIESRASAPEIAHMTRSYAQQIEATQIRYALVGDYIWVRILGRTTMNLLYHRHRREGSEESRLKKALP
jgi:hypothetical protein